MPCRQVLFQTARLDARRLTQADVPGMHAIYGDPEVVRYVGDGEPLDEAGCARWVEITDRNFDLRGYGMVALVDRKSGVLVGCAGIVHPDQQPEPEVKYAFRSDQWGRGFATEAIKGLLFHATDHWDVTEVMATVHPDNSGSQKVLTKLGFRLRETRTDEDGPTQVWIYTA